eukprot:scaffold28116_cov110-Isochrysis_galbana.AAC.2
MVSAALPILSPMSEAKLGRVTSLPNCDARSWTDRVGEGALAVHAEQVGQLRGGGLLVLSINVADEPSDLSEYHRAEAQQLARLGAHPSAPSRGAAAGLCGATLPMTPGWRRGPRGGGAMQGGV